MLEQLREELVTRSRGLPDSYFRLRGLWRIEHCFQPNAHERQLSYGMVLGQTLAQGCAYTDLDAPRPDMAALGGDVRDLRVGDLAQNIATLDAGFAVLPSNPVRRLRFAGNSDAKAVERAAIIVDEVMAQLDRVGGRKVLNIGVMGNFFPHLLQRGVEVVAADYDPSVIANAPSGVTIHHGASTLDLIKHVPLVLATGMTLATDTLPSIIAECQRHGTGLILFAATGAAFGEAYCRACGVDAVISEPQPQYIFQGTSEIQIFRRT